MKLETFAQQQPLLSCLLDTVPLDSHFDPSPLVTSLSQAPSPQHFTAEEAAPLYAVELDHIEAKMLELVEQIVGVTVDKDAPLAALGVDSLAAVELGNAIQETFNVSFSATLVYDHPTVAEASKHVQSQLSVNLQAAPISSVSQFSPWFVDRTCDRAQSAHIGIFSISSKLPCTTPNEIHGTNDLISIVPYDRWDMERHLQTFQENSTVRFSGFMDKLELFDAEAFQTRETEARFMDPQQRLMLQQSYEVLAAPGKFSPDAPDLPGTGVYLGIYPPEYNRIISSSCHELTPYHATGGTSSAAAGRISFSLALKGPCLSLDTACSSTMVAIHVARHDLLSDVSRMSIIGGVNTILSVETLKTLAAASMLSGSRCKTLDADADGYIRGEASAAMLIHQLKPDMPGSQGCVG
eukprot:scaffold197323_cov46-Prasinocladus_malaysianus.AAC.1